MTPGADEQGQRSLSRERLVSAALALIQEQGLDGLSMRALAERLDVKAASLYWHVRDRKELLELVAGAILDSVRRPRTTGGWRQQMVAIAAALGERVRAQKDAARILLEVPEAQTHSETFKDLKAQLTAAGLPAAGAADVALMVMTYVITGQVPADVPPDVTGGEPAELAIDTGSRGVTVRAGSPDMEALVRVAGDRGVPAPAVVRGEKVIVQRLRGVGRGELELNPRRPWRFHVQAPTWKTVLEIGGLEMRSLHVDSGAAKLEVFLPQPLGVVPIHISSGVVEVKLHRPHGTAAVVELSTGAVQVKLDDFSTRATVFDTHWETPNGSESPDRFEIRVSSGAVKIELDSYALASQAGEAAEPVADTVASPRALDILLDGVEARIAAQRAER